MKLHTPSSVTRFLIKEISHVWR